MLAVMPVKSGLRSYGGLRSVAIEDIATGLKELRKTGFMEIR